MSQFYIGVTAGSLPPVVPTSFVTDSGTVIPAANIVNVNGGPGVQVVANPTSSNNMVINLTGILLSYVNVVGPAAYVVSASDYYISCDSTLGLITVKLPNSPTLYDTFAIKDRTGTSDTINITVTTVGGAILIDGSTSYIFDEKYESIEVIFNGTSYEIY